MPSPYLIFLACTLCILSTAFSYTQPFEYSATSPIIVRERAARFYSSEVTLEKRDYCGGMYCDCPNECIDDNTCTTNVALLPCLGGGGGGESCEAGKQLCPDGTGCCGVDEICDDTNNSCLGCKAGTTICGTDCCGTDSTCVAGVCQGGSESSAESESSTLALTSKSPKSSAAATLSSSASRLSSTSPLSSASPSTSASPLSSAAGAGAGTNGAGAALSSTAGSGATPSSTPKGAAVTLRDSIGKLLASLVVGWIIFWL